MIVWIIILLCVLGGSGWLTAVVLPRTFLTLRYTVKQSNDRCIKRVQEVNGQSMVFEPEIKWRKYIKQYVVSDRSDKKQLMIKTNGELTYISYDVVVFNCRDEVETVLKVNEYIDGNTYGKIVDLPEETSYIAIHVMRADNQLFQDKLTAKVPIRKILKYLILNALVLFIEALWIKICMSNLLGGVFRESFVWSGMGLLITLSIVGAAIVVNSLVVIIAIMARKKKYTIKVSKNA